MLTCNVGDILRCFRVLYPSSDHCKCLPNCCTSVKQTLFWSDDSALDKLLGQLGTYAMWLSSIAYFQKTIAYFHIFYATFFSSVITRFLIALGHRECTCIFIHSNRLPF